jgi:hypothetical protein
MFCRILRFRRRPTSGEAGEHGVSFRLSVQYGCTETRQGQAEQFIPNRMDLRTRNEAAPKGGQAHMKLRRSILTMLILLGIFSITLASTAQALTISFADPVGDQTGTIDVIGMAMTFSKKSGQYLINLTASSDHPFLGEFRVNINLYNPEAPKPSARFFSDDCKNCGVFDPKTNSSDFNLVASTTTLTLKKGTSKVLKSWDKGDHVAINSVAGLGSPAGVSFFRSSVDNMPFTFLTNEDTIGYNNVTGDGVTDGVAVISP